ncbi:hypothetical protein SAMN05421788_101837 [Filimonas lacunae]|uniref:Uncharacterized protein n=1 Tax=Filimonas lacunae TaxID=477680 RepID=A0A173MPU1_9BACT|nr:hypothetical protein [Filimonas lacunae]BAV09401.1 hypothetical protein FLA_5449 [Filimonas lacunae]SIS72476.1 hypothetical protein SAMN05421788_101837 [Filimonas lacunae]
MTDLLLNDTNDLLINENTGDWIIGNSDTQHQRLLLVCTKGSFKENPTCGVGVASYLEDENPTALLREVRLQFSSDGMKVSEVAIENNQLKVNATYP